MRVMSMGAPFRQASEGTKPAGRGSEFQSERWTPATESMNSISRALIARGLRTDIHPGVVVLMQATGPGMAPGVTIAAFEASADIDRRDFNVNFEGTLENGSVVVSHKVNLEFVIEATKQD